jgi:NAD-dependent SIR2 family protein deacetylase
MFALASKAMSTKFHELLGHASDRVVHLTQNTDCLEDKLLSLPYKTLHLHGRLDTLFCQLRSTHTFQITSEDFEGSVTISIM